MDMIRRMEMTYSYKPVLIKAILKLADSRGKVQLDEIVSFFREFYDARIRAGLTAEKQNSIFAKGGYTDKETIRNILAYPFKRFEYMQMLRHTKTLGIIEVEPTVWKNLTDDEVRQILDICDEKLERYYGRFGN